jgi:hypothetical protein
MSVKSLLYTKITADSPLNALGYNDSNVFHGQTMDNVPKDVRKFIIISFGETFAAVPGQRGAGRTSEHLVNLFVYTREKDWAEPSLAAVRLRALADEIVGERTGLDATDGYISTCEWTGDMPDSYDEVYEAMSTVVRWSVVATGA